MTKFLYEFYWDCGRSGSIEGLFIEEEKNIKKIVGKDVYFGEVLGKFSEVYGTIEEGEITKVDIPTDVVELLENKIGETLSGFNPFNYLQFTCKECNGNYEECDLKICDMEKEDYLCEYCHSNE